MQKFTSANRLRSTGLKQKKKHDFYKQHYRFINSEIGYVWNKEKGFKDTVVVVRRNIKDRQRLMLIQNQDSTHNFMPIRMRIQTKTRSIK